MQTQCPYCETRFRITEAQVSLADGLVRCGVCQEVFNAFEVADQHEHRSTLLETDALGDLEKWDDDCHDASELDRAAEADDSANFSTAQLPVQTEASDQVTNELDFFSEDDSFSKSVVPDNFRESYTKRSRGILPTLLWSIAILLLTATLILEHIWFNRDQFSQIPEIQASLKKLCSYIECRDLSVREPKKIELVSRNVYSHPKEKDALVVDVTMKNNADFAQPYPVMQIDFSNIRGQTVAARRFLPAEYLPDNSNPAARLSPKLSPHQSQTVSIEIRDPGKEAMTYEFNFL